MNHSDTPGITCELCTAADVDELIGLLAEVFAERDPPAVAVNVTAAEFAEFVRLFAPRAVDRGLTFVARDAATGEMVGALLADDVASELPEGLDRLTPKLEPVFDILGELDEEYRAGRTILPGEAVHVFLLGVGREAAGRGLGQRLVEVCLANALGLGYRMAVTEATNKTSQHIFRKLGFAERVRRSYADYRAAGRAPFESIGEQGGPILMDRTVGRQAADA
jgi:ribosomal protein S18 acetylase RimI-like enzyme